MKLYDTKFQTIFRGPKGEIRYKIDIPGLEECYRRGMFGGEGEEVDRNTVKSIRRGIKNALLVKRKEKEIRKKKFALLGGIIGVIFFLLMGVISFIMFLQLLNHH